MDVSPQAIRDVEFREKLRGYHQDDVDEFLERVAAGLEILHERLRVANERAERAEQQVGESREDDSSLRRTLVLAQRTADLAVREANEQAATILASAESRAAALVDSAVEEARRLADEAHSLLRSDVERLESARSRLRQDVERLLRYIDEQRSRAKAVLADAARNLDDSVPPPAPAPVLHEVDLEALPAPATGSAARGQVGSGPYAGDAGDAGSVEAVGAVAQEPVPADVDARAEVAGGGEEPWRPTLH